MDSRQPVIAGNWKMNTTRSEAIALASAVVSEGIDARVEVILFPPALWLEAVSRVTADSPVKSGCQDSWYEENGAFTGQLSPLMVRELGTHVILGHSEHRRDAQETNAIVARKVRAAMDAGLVPIFCVGEPSGVRDADTAESYVKDQVDSVIHALENVDVPNLIVAYEPIWAIGTGLSASAEDAESMSGTIRTYLSQRSDEFAAHVRILYGGSVSPENARNFLAEDNVDGLLVGGASLDADRFVRIVNSCYH